jgi:hypothetical protein
MNIDIEVDDVLWAMSRREKKEMYEALKDEIDDRPVLTVQNFIPLSSDERKKLSYCETELFETLLRIWQNRNFIELSDVDALKYYVNK